MATRAEVDDNDPSRLKAWLKVRGLGYSGMKKDELVA